MKELPEGLSNFHQIQLVVRKAKKKGGNKIKLQNIKIARNIFVFIYFILRTLKNKKSNYLLVDITPYTFFSFLILFIFRKKIFLYLRSSGHEEWRHILGSWSVRIFHLMYRIVTSKSEVIVNNLRLYKDKKCHLINASRLDDLWFKEYKDPFLNKVKLLYVGRINPEKGINDLIKILNQIKLDLDFSIAGDIKNYKIENKNIKLLGYISDPKLMIDTYDAHNIIVLPSFTEGQPYVLDECLARKRPIIIFEDIAYLAKGKNGIFVTKRDPDSFMKTTKYIMDNYYKIQKNIEKNKFFKKKDMIEQISNIIS